jgi:beta-glucanase (GH16 family)
MAYQKYDTTCLTVHNEIDIFEPGGYEYNGNTDVCGWWYENGNCGNYSPGHQKYVSPTPLFLAYHKFAVEWLPNALVFFMDDVPVYENYNSPTFIMHPLKIFMDLQLEDTTEKFCPGVTFPQYMQIDYFRYYKLNLDCGTSSVILTNSDLTNYVFSVKSDITIGNGANVISLNPSDNKSFRAVNSITIYGDFTAPLGSELALLPTQCN